MQRIKERRRWIMAGMTLLFVLPLIIRAQPHAPGQAKADLVVKMISRGSSVGSHNNTPLVKAKIINRGKGDASNFIVYLMLGKKPRKAIHELMSAEYPILKKRRVTLLKPGQSLLLNFTGFTIPSNIASGEYLLITAADPENRVLERVKDNNLADSPFFLRAVISRVQDAPTGESFGGELFPEVEILGMLFGTKDNKKVRFGTMTLDVYPQDWSDTRLFFDLGPHIDCGRYKVYLVIGSQPISNKVDFLLKCWIAGAEPLAGASPGQQVTLDGRNFGHTQGNKKIMFGSAEAAVVSWSTNKITVTVPSLAPGTYSVTMEQAGENVSSGLYYTVL